MTWRDQLRPASFRGVRFHVDEDELTGGRRTVEHEHPEADGITVEDMGRQARRFRVTGYVLGADYMTRRDQLLAALEEHGPGTLVHPQFGERQVAVLRDGVSIRHSTREGGLATFQLSFVEVAAAETRPVAVADTAARLGVAAADAGGAEIEWSKSALDIDGEPGWSIDDLGARADDALGVVETPFAAVWAQISRVRGALEGAASLLGQGRALLAQPGALATSLSNLMIIPAKNLTIIPASFRSVRRGAPGRLATQARLAALTVAATVPTVLAPIPAGAFPDTPARRRQRELQQALVGTVTRMALVAAAQSTIAETFASRQEAEAARDTLAEALEASLLVAPDEIFAPLSRLHAATVRHLTVQAHGLVPLRRLSTGAIGPALVVAHDLYGDDPTRTLPLEADLVARNRRQVRHPGFVPAATDLEVLAR